MTDDEIYAQIRHRVNRNYMRRLLYVLHVILFGFANGMLWFFLPGLFWSGLWFFLCALWFLLGIIHTVWLVAVEARDWTIRREIEHERLLRSVETARASEKPKRDRLMLGDDGEVVEIFDDEDEWRLRSR